MGTWEPQCIAPVGDWCGEGPVWCAEEQSLYWTDINRFLIHRLDPEGAVRIWTFDEPVVALTVTGQPGTLAVVLGSRVVYWTPSTGEQRDHGFHLPGWPAVRCNEARPDPRGSLWIGSMKNNVAADGAPLEAGGNDGVLYRIDADGAVSQWKQGIGISNTMAWSPDRSRFYFADTLRNAIYVYDYNLQTGAISNERPFLTGFEKGKPDGSAMDREGYLWNCRHSGGAIVRISPDGAIDRVVEMPVTNITSCTFGGADYSTLYITTASLEAPPKRFAGSLFSLKTEVPGLPEHRFL